jgi:hypothetical protein
METRQLLVHGRGSEAIQQFANRLEPIEIRSGTAR